MARSRRIVKARFALGTTMAIGLVFCYPQVEATALPVERPMSTERTAGADLDLPYAVKIRAEMGLNSDADYINGVAGRADSTTDVMGTPLTPSERADILGREVLTQWVEIVQAAAVGDPAFAGTWIDQTAGGVLHIAAAGPDANGTFNSLRPLLPDSDQIIFDRVDYSLSTIRATQALITDDLVARKPFISHVIESAVSTQENRVVLTVDSQMSSEDRQALATSYGPAVEIRISDGGQYVPQSRDFPTGRTLAGAWLSSALSTCTIGYGATQNSAGQLYAVTAGHCRGTNFRQGYFYNGNSMGQSHANLFNSGSGNCDCQAVGPLAPSGQAGRDLLIDNNAIYDLTHTGGKPEQSTGTYVCHSGANSYDKNGGHIVCGRVVSDEVSIPYQPDEFGNQFVLYDATTASIVTLHGDSGGPLNKGNALLGLNSAYNTGLAQTAFSKVYNLTARIGLTFLY